MLFFGVRKRVFFGSSPQELIGALGGMTTEGFCLLGTTEGAPPARCVEASMKLKKQVTVCGAAVFCVAVFSLYLMLDRVQHDPTGHQNGGNFPRVSHAAC